MKPWTMRGAGLVLMLLLLTRPTWAISDAELYQLSMQEASRVEARYGLVRDPVIVGGVQAVFSRVAAAAQSSKWPLVLRVLDAPDPNAFCLPNGLIYLNRGLLTLQPTQDELAFVLAHEASHVTHEHTRKQIQQAEVQGGILSILLGGSDLGGLAAQVIAASLQSGYSRQSETEADRTALAVTARAGYDPAAALTFFKKLQAVEKKGGVRVFPSHPLTTSRIQNVEKWLAQSRPPGGSSTPSPSASPDRGSTPPRPASTTQPGRLPVPAPTAQPPAPSQSPTPTRTSTPSKVKPPEVE